MEITQEYNVDCASQRMVIVKGEIGICLKGEVRQFSSLLPGIVQYTMLYSCTIYYVVFMYNIVFHIHV
jgi:hypothetical protein